MNNPLAIAETSREYFARVDALMQATAHESVEALVEECAAMLLRQPWRANRIFAGATFMTPEELTIAIRRRLRAGNLDMNRWIGLRALLRVAADPRFVQMGSAS